LNSGTNHFSAIEVKTFSKKNICPYCQTKIKDGADNTICSVCGIPHHRECWDENKGCTTYGCEGNPVTENVITEQTISASVIQDETQSVAEPAEVECPQCKEKTEAGAQFCKQCGYNLSEDKSEVKKEAFEKEYLSLYKLKAMLARKRLLITSASIFVLLLVLFITFFTSVRKINSYVASDDYKMKTFVTEWKDAWESKDILKYGEFLDKDYIYYDKDKKTYNLQERLKRIQYTFVNNKKIKIYISNIKVQSDSTSGDYLNVTFNQTYISDKIEESGKKTLRLYRNADTGKKWKVFREYFE